MKIILAPILVIMLALIPSSVLAHSDEYLTGYNDGGNQAQFDVNHGSSYSNVCPPNNSDHYCAGYYDGYNRYWNTADHSTNFNPQTDQQSSVNIKGNNNRVTVNQQTNNQFGSNNGGSSDGHHHGSGQLPNCQFLCLGVNVH